jgi:hypothetical protein
MDNQVYKAILTRSFAFLKRLDPGNFAPDDARQLVVLMADIEKEINK